MSIVGLLSTKLLLALQSTKAEKEYASLQRSTLLVFEELHLPQALFGLGQRLIRTTQILARFLRNDFIAALNLLNHAVPSVMPLASLLEKLLEPVP
jgi:hypothetical protein